MAKAIYVTSSVCLYVYLFVGMFVRLFDGLYFCDYSNITTSTLTIYYKAQYFEGGHLPITNPEVKGQRSRSQGPSRSNHVNQFFSKSFNSIFTKLCVYTTYIVLHNRLDFGKDPDTKTLAKSGICYIGWAFFE